MFNPKINIAFFLRNLRRSAAFTLVEMLVVIAILGILAAVALPAYNNYSLKSKFAEVVLATAPTKTAISTCAVSGDCVSGGAVYLSAGIGAAPANGGYASLPSPQTFADFQNFIYSGLVYNGASSAAAKAWVAS